MVMPRSPEAREWRDGSSRNACARSFPPSGACHSVSCKWLGRPAWRGELHDGPRRDGARRDNPYKEFLYGPFEQDELDQLNAMLERRREQGWDLADAARV